jgi:hypothetical protein
MKYLRESTSNFDDHKSKCRICIDESEVHRQLRIDEEIRSLILELQLEVHMLKLFEIFVLHIYIENTLICKILQLILTRTYSNFICWKCYVNLQQFSSFRSLVNEKQQKLSQFLCRIKSQEQREPLESSEHDDTENDPLNVETIVVKAEPPDFEDPEPK